MFNNMQFNFKIQCSFMKFLSIFFARECINNIMNELVWNSKFGCKQLKFSFPLTQGDKHKKSRGKKAHHKKGGHKKHNGYHKKNYWHKNFFDKGSKHHGHNFDYDFDYHKHSGHFSFPLHFSASEHIEKTINSINPGNEI